MWENRIRNKTIPNFLVKWKGLPIEDATSKGEEIFNNPNLKLLEDKKY